MPKLNLNQHELITLQTLLQQEIICQKELLRSCQLILCESTQDEEAAELKIMINLEERLNLLITETII